MIYLRQLLYIFLTFAFSTVSGQVVNKMMYTTQNDAGYLDFVFAPTTNTEIASTTIATNAEGITHVQNSIGQLLFYVTSNGIYNPAGALLSGSPTVFGDEKITEVNVSKIPGSANQYYVFYTRSTGCSHLYYSKVDMSGGSGIGLVYSANTLLGDTTITNDEYAEGKEIVDIPLSSEKWLIAYNCTSGFEKYKITSTGVQGPTLIKQWQPGSIPNPTLLGKGELDYHAENVVYASAASNQVHTFGFDPCDGVEVPGSSKTFQTLAPPYGVEFSPTAFNMFVTFMSPAATSTPPNANFARIRNVSTAAVEYAVIDNADDCNSTNPINNFNLGQLELGSNYKIYAPAVGTCTIFEFDDLEAATYSVAKQSVGLPLNKGLSDIIQSSAFLSFIQLNVTTKHIECYGAGNGEISLEIKGGIPPYEVTWFDGSSALNRTALTSGSYGVTIKDASCSGTSLYRPIYVTEPDSISVQIDTEDALCFDGPGELQYEIKGGTPPYTLKWPEDYDPNYPTAGEYKLLIIDQHGCTQVGEFEIDQPDIMRWEDTVINATCFDDLGEIHINNLRGGTPPYLINGAPDTILYLKAGWHNIRIVDRRGCEYNTSLNIEHPNEITIDIELEQKDCSVFEAQATAITEGGSGPLTLEWLAVDSTSIAPGKYAVRAVDSNGCDGYEVFTFTPDQTKYYEPNIFTPNGDGHNEFFQPGLYCYREFSFSVFSRWGELVFESTPDNLKWFGFNKDGELLPSDVYIYRVEYIDAEGLSHTKESSVMLTY